MGKIRRNALNYSVKDYEEILLENLDTISDTKEKFQKYRELLKQRLKRQQQMDKVLTSKQMKNRNRWISLKIVSLTKNGKQTIR